MLPILYRASDDHGLGQARLRYELQRPFTEGERAQTIPLAKRQDAITSYEWSLEELALRPKDELRFWIEVRDNDGYNGPKWGIGGTHTAYSVPDRIFDDISNRRAK